MRTVLCLLSGFFFLACSTVRVVYDYDQEVDFSAYTTYNYFSDMESSLGPLDEERLLGILDSTLQSRGYRLVEEPDFLINILSSTHRTGPRHSVGVGLGGGGGNLGGGISVGIPVGSPPLQRTIEIDFVDAQRDALFWQAMAEMGYREGEPPWVKEEKLAAMVKKVFSKFPPKQK